jgi:hypothetical protein
MNDIAPISMTAVPAITSAGSNRFIAQKDPFSDRRIDAELPAGMTIEAMLDHVGLRPELRRFAHVTLCDAEMRADPVEIPRRNWAKVRPHPGVVVTLRVAPAGGGGGKKSILGIVLKIVVIIAAAVATFFGQPEIAMGIPMLGKLNISQRLKERGQ